MYNQIGSTIRQLRIKKNISQKEMASRLFMTQSGYAKIERGESKIDVIRLLEFSDILEMSLYEILPSAKKSSYILDNVSGGNINEEVHIVLTELKNTYESTIKYLRNEIQFLRSQSMTNRNIRA